MNKRVKNFHRPRRKPVHKEIISTTKRRLRWVPNTLTLCNSWCGFASILWTLTVYERACSTEATYNVLAISALIILGAMVFDVLDGYAARMLNATSEHGIQMDSLSDMVTFGVAPAVLIAILTHKLQGQQTTVQLWMTYLLSSLYVGGTALRLATYNVKAMHEHSSDGLMFHGLPSPGAAAAIASLVLAMRIHDGNLERLAITLPIYAAFLGALMVSPLPYMHLGKWFLSRNKQPLKIVLLIVALYLVAIFRENAIFLIITGYILSGPITAVARLFAGKKHKQA